MKNTDSYQNLYGEIDPKIPTKGEKPSHYLGYFDSSEKSINEAFKVIRKTAESFFSSNKPLFINTGYSVDDLENEIHLKLLHKFKKDPPFWVENLSNLKTISHFTLSKLIRILNQESKPITQTLPSLGSDSDESDENNFKDIIFADKQAPDQTDELMFQEFYNGFKNYLSLNTTNSINKKDYLQTTKRKDYLKNFAEVFKYNLYLNYKIDLNLTREEKEMLNKKFKGMLREEEIEKQKHSGKKIINSDNISIKQLFKVLEIEGTTKEYIEELKKFCNIYGLNTDLYQKELKEQKLLLKGTNNIQDLDPEQLNKLTKKGAIIEGEKLIGIKERINRLNKNEKQRVETLYGEEAKPEYKYKEVNLKIIKYKIPRTKAEKRERRLEKRTSVNKTLLVP